MVRWDHYMHLLPFLCLNRVIVILPDDSIDIHDKMQRNNINDIDEELE